MQDTMNSSEPTTRLKISLKYGGILGVLGIILSLASYLLGFNTPGHSMSKVISLISIILTVSVFYVGIKAYRESNKSLSVGDGVVIGILIGLIAGLINAIYLFIYCNALDPTFLDNLMEESIKNAPEMEADAEDSYRNMMSKFFSPAFMAAMALIMNFFIGLIGGLILGLILKEEKTEYPDLT